LLAEAGGGARRKRPRELSHAVRALRTTAAPPTLLARVQERWASVVGDAVAAEAEPVSERAGVVTVACSSAVWAAELSLLVEDLRVRLNEALPGEPGPSSAERVLGLRVVTRPR
jgi:predicted nucleic acid-binding Zn ribbon protein